MPSYGTSKAVTNALERRGVKARTSGAVVQSFIKQVHANVSLTLVDRVHLATEYLRTRIIKNISKPVGRDKAGNVIERSKPGEFPRADTTQLMKTIFTDYEDDPEGNWCEGYVATPLDYGLFLELFMDRSYLSRTLYEELDTIEEIIAGKVEHGEHEGQLLT